SSRATQTCWGKLRAWFSEQMNANESFDHTAHAVRARSRDLSRQLSPLRAEGDRAAHRKMARAGLRRPRCVPEDRRPGILLMWADEQYGGAGIRDFRYE